MESRIFLKVSDLERLTGTQRRNCEYQMQVLRDVMGKKKLPNGRYQEITILEYCEYNGLRFDEVCEKLKIRC